MSEPRVRRIDARPASPEVDEYRELVKLAQSPLPDNPDAAELKQVAERRDALAERILKGIEGVQSRGCLVKDVARGLVDFYALSGDRLIFLCWQLGERSVEHWHTLEGGFSGRQPLDSAERG